MAETREKVTITLPKSLIAEIKSLAGPRGRSKFIAEAVAMFMRQRQRSKLRKQLIAGYASTAESDRAIAEEWSATEDAVWEKYV